MGRVVLWSLVGASIAALKALRHPKAEFSTNLFIGWCGRASSSAWTAEAAIPT
jgi:hypothetical protein